MIRILVIEDAPESASLAQRVLGEQKYEVILATTGGEGLKMAVETSPDMVLLDLGLPDIDAETIVKRLCDLAELAGKPMLVVSAWPETTVRRITQSYCFKDYIIKPYSIDVFIEKVAGYLN